MNLGVSMGYKWDMNQVPGHGPEIRGVADDRNVLTGGDASRSHAAKVAGRMLPNTLSVKETVVGGL